MNKVVLDELERELKREVDGGFGSGEFWGQCYIPLSPERREETNNSLEFKIGGQKTKVVM